MIKSEQFRYFSIKSYVVDVYWNRLTDFIENMVIMQKISYYLIYSKRFHGYGGVLVMDQPNVIDNHNAKL